MRMEVLFNQEYPIEHLSSQSTTTMSKVVLVFEERFEVSNFGTSMTYHNAPGLKCESDKRTKTN